MQKFGGNSVKYLDEREQALRVANMWLEFQMNPLTQMVHGDPDCDACVLARQYLRALDRIDQLVRSRTAGTWDAHAR